MAVKNKVMSHQRKAAFRKKIEVLLDQFEMDYGPFEFAIERFEPGHAISPPYRLGRARHIFKINEKKP